MFKLKTLPPDSIASALEKAERYRLLNEPYEAESICTDILQAAPDNQEAVITLLLALTDKFKEELYPAFDQSLDVLKRLDDRHCRPYYRGIIYERRAKAKMLQAGPGSGEAAHDWFIKAMTEYERALETCPPANQNAALRWNACARILNNNPQLKPAGGNREVEIVDGYE